MTRKLATSALNCLEEIAAVLDEEEDKNQVVQSELALIDEFDSDPVSENIPDGSMSSAEVGTAFNSAQSLAISVNPGLSVQSRLSLLLGEKEDPPGTIQPPLDATYSAVPSITYQSVAPPSILEGQSAEEEKNISGLKGLIPSDIHIIRLTLQYKT